MSDLESLVTRTEGPQWWRKVVHAMNATIIASAMAFIDWADGTLLLVLGAAVGLLVIFDWVRLANPRVNALFFRTFVKLASPREARSIASSTWYALGILTAVALFPRAEAIAGILVLGLSDPAAALVGQRLGRRPFLGGTLEGSLAFLVVAVAVLALLRYPWPVVFVAAVVSALTERKSWPLDDNLAVPVVCAGALYGLALLL